ncbi:MAG: Unknown protein [uncultured Thiotrichaceae bacterium]|uniref:Polysaccharide deacetylase n=1 Tax=uncultured Thiotrichaceae bacterium TaxID=298394 RepID=A0A6S6SX54_9GAMM|nr:MAG: Unknown protein [uncultured Thiotrichaceae bacterium]
MADWQAIDEELSHWSHPAELWWRDDDAIANTPELQLIIAHSEQYAIPLHLAVIPGHLETSLVDELAARHQVYALQHGLSHQNHARPQQRKIEMGGAQSQAELQQKLSDARLKLSGQFGDNYLDILVPPWNRIEDPVRAVLPEIGYQRLSILGSPNTASIIPEVNVHIDIIDWKQHSFVGEEQVLNALLDNLRRRRIDNIYNKEPTGLMTHHLQHDQACTDFLARFFADCATRKTLKWIGGSQLLQAHHP